MPACVALVVAGGRGSRFGPGTPKQYRLVAGIPVLRRAVQPFLAHPQVNEVRVVIHREDDAAYQESMGDLPLLPPAYGGTSRQESVLRGLESLTSAPPERVLVHDAARPFVTAAILDRVIRALDDKWHGAVPALPVVDTLKRAGAAVGNSHPAVASTVDRAGLWRVQTPQGFGYSPLLEAHRRCAGLTLTDDAAVAEYVGLRIALVAGEEDNLKVTTEDDLHRCERLLAGEFETRTGFGFDVHRFCEGREVMLCGVAVPHDQSLLGHSDADVGLHAVTDALLGAIGEGDIGAHFPPSDPRWRGAPSEVFLRHAAKLVREKGGSIVNIDVTLICERPKIGPYRDSMRVRIAELLGVSPARVSIKATTTEQLGFTGRREGIAAQAIATVRLPSAGQSPRVSEMSY
jgi:2-C-methyl-D-erythritol 4-phosphate cytidylyltransferase/2-C-methyl-D-erythritol 2,4-cyclodiphosphate synthase